MIFKVYYQENEAEIPVRENTKTLYLDAENERAVRHILKDRPINIEYVQLIDGAYLEYEKQSEFFTLLESK
ncbi:DNA-dependent RNA polymerase subunit epsilon [Bacillus sp. FSL K6-3431]|uniref:DNA-dependent RNA polymerase subunit epsilon n=1 Tax=Bacillus sp. FSL K6-3431 TaxID=2921500 RepID=UPI0030F92FF6